jgi:hypothetical protein
MQVADSDGEVKKKIDSGVCGTEVLNKSAESKPNTKENNTTGEGSCREGGQGSIYLPIGRGRASGERTYLQPPSGGTRTERKSGGHGAEGNESKKKPAVVILMSERNWRACVRRRAQGQRPQDATGIGQRRCRSNAIGRTREATSTSSQPCSLRLSQPLS